jgi:hypothetical protein
MCRRPGAIGAVKTRDLRGVLMRRLWPLLFLLLVSPAVADALDCAVIKSTDWTTTEHGKDPLAVPMRQQVTRNADGAVVSESTPRFRSMALLMSRSAAAPIR